MGFIDPDTLPQAEPKPGWHGRFFHSEHMTFAYYEIDADAALHVHSHPNEEVWHILEGKVDVTLGEETRCVGAGQAVVIPGGTTHAVAVKERCRAIVVDYPVRHEVGGVKI
jgi:mannose-6-phosphate isomerase-like protein (cupin superfamily)